MGEDLWDLVAVSVLPPGWKNVYKQEDGSTELEDCPAILTERRRDSGEVRAVFASTGGEGQDAELWAASSAANYDRTIYRP